jgi:hypothetical protein
VRWPRSHAVLAAALALVGLAACSSRDDDLPTETLTQVVARVAPPASAVVTAPVDEPGSYRIEFDRYVVNQASATTVGKGATKRKALKASHFTRNVIRPFNQTGIVNRSLGFVREQGAGLRRVSFLRPLPDDPRPRVYPPLPDKHARRLVIAGRDCHATTVVREEFCIDSAGLVLMTRGKASLEIATKVTLDTTVKSAAELTASLAEGFTDPDQGSIRPMHPDSAPPGTDYSLDAPPAGFELVGRYAVAPLTAEVLKRSSLKVVAGIVDVYVRGGDALVIERGGKLDRTKVGDEDLGTLVDSRDVDLGHLGTGKAGTGGVAPFGYREVRAFPATGRYVVVAGTLPEAELLAITRSLRQWPGTTIQYLD